MRGFIQKPLGRVLVGVAVLVSAGAIVVPFIGGSTGDTANLWVNTSAGASPTRCSSVCAYNSNTAYGSLSAAYAAASPGDTIKIQAGSYGSFTLANRTGMSASRVNVAPATGAAVSFTDVEWLASYVTMTGAFTFRTLNVGDRATTPAARVTDVTFDGLTVDHQDASSPSRRAMLLSATDNVTIRNFDIGNTFAGLSVGEDSNLIQTWGGSNTFNTSLVIEQGTFHDNDAPSSTLAHNECLYMVDVAPLTVRRVDFKSCTYYGIFMTDFNNGGTETGDNLLIENNIFRQGQIEGSGGGGYVWAMSFHPQVDESPLTNAVIQNNTIENGLSLGFTGASSGLTVRNNIIAKGIYQDDASSGQCKTGVTFAYNVMPFACGSNTTVRTESQIRADWTSVSTTWGGTEDFHLTGATPAAAGAGDPASFPATDFGGDLRGSPPDAGAYEFGPAPTPTPTPTATPTSTPSSGEANIFIEVGAGACAGGRSSTPITYAASASPDRRCGTFDAAWDAMNSGDTAICKAGSYGFQSVTGAKTSTTKIICEDGTTLGGGTSTCISEFAGDQAFCTSNSDFLWLENVSIDTAAVVDSAGSIRIRSDSPNVTLKDVDMIGDVPNIWIHAPGFSWLGGTLGEVPYSGRPLRCSDSGVEPMWLQSGASDILIDGVVWGIYRTESGPPNTGICGDDGVAHLEYIRFDSDTNDNVTIKNSSFSSGADVGSGYFFSSVSVDNLVLINNYFGDPNAPDTFMQMPLTSCTGWKWLYNTFKEEPGVSGAGENSFVLGCGNFLKVGNLAPESPGGCAGASSIKNVWGDTGSCGTDLFVGETADLGIDDTTGKLNAGSPGINAGEAPGASDHCTDPTTVNSLDFEGNTRPFDDASDVCDAGRDER